MMPANGAQVMKNCYAPPGAGLEPFALERSDSFFVVGQDHFPLGAFWDSTQDIEYLVTLNQSTEDLNIFGRTAGAGGAWTLIENMGFGGIIGSLTLGKVSFSQFIFGTGITGATTDVRTVWGYYSGTSTQGVWSTHGLGAADNTQILSNESVGYVTVHQDRIVAADGTHGNSTRPSQIRWTDPGATTFPTGNFLRLTSGDRKGVAFLKSYSPSDLVVGMADGAFYLIQGDLSDPIVRRMDQSLKLCNSNKNPGSVGITNVPGGIAIQADKHGIFATVNGSSYEHLSPQLVAVFDGQGGPGGGNLNFNTDIVYHKGFLFVPQANPVTDPDTRNYFVYDWEGKYWFTIDTLHAGQYCYRRDSHIVGLSGDTTLDDFSMSYIDLDDLANPGGERTTNYIWRSAPFRSPSGRELEVREVQIIAKSRVDSSAQFTVLIRNEFDENQQFTMSMSADTETVLSSPARLRGRYVDVQIQAMDLDAGSGTGAPSIEAVRIGVLPGHRIYS